MNRILNIAITMVSIISLFTGSALALTPVPQEKLKSITGQAGIVLNAQDVLGIGFNADRLLYLDEDGTDGTPALISLNNIEYAGRITLNNPVSVVPALIPDPYTGTLKKGVDIQMNGAEVVIDRFHVSSITLEGVQGAAQKYMNAGKSFGSITVEGFHAEITGSVRITSF